MNGRGISIASRRVTRWTGQMLRLVETRNICNKPYGKRPLGRQIHRRKDYIKIFLCEIACGDVNWTKFRVLFFSLIMEMNLPVS